MSLLSFVIPVHGVQGYLRQCLDSILAQSFTDLEIVAVDDASTDHCGQILDSYAARDPRVRVLHLPSNVGLGEARNIGLAEASGEYVWFVDSDDWIAAGCLRPIAARLTALEPDILLVDHTRASWLGQHTPSTGGELLAEVQAAGVVDLADQPRLLELFTVAWNKILRREFLERTGLRFDNGWYEDLPFTFPALVAADRIGALNRVCYHYRRRRTEAITQTRSDRHFEVFDQWTRVFSRLDDLGERADPFRTAIFDRMVWHLLVVQSRPDRLPRQHRRAFFHELSRFYRHYREQTPHTAGGQLDRLRHHLVAADGYQRLRALRLSRSTVDHSIELAQTGLRNGWAAARTLARGAANAAGHAYYHAQRRLPLDDHLAVYAAYWYRGVACNPAAIYAAARDLAPRVSGIWIVDRDHRNSLPPGTPHVVAGTPGYFRALARARYLINNVNFPDFVVKRRGSVHLQTHHGTPVKVMGLDQGAYPIGANGMDLDRLMRRCDRWDFSLSSNAHSTEMWARAYPAPYETLEYGYPRNDRLALAEPHEIAAARDELGANGRTVVLYAPTHREYAAQPPDLLDPAQVADALGPDVLLLLRSHYLDPEATPLTHPRVLDVSAHPSIEDLLLASDILITDYSSLMFDYAVLDRPIIVYAPDWDAYRRTRGVTFDLLAEPPGVVATSQADLVDAFITGDVLSEAATKARAQFRERFCYLDDGRAADRVVRRVFADMLG
jgi:CDP-glycerol glycerophosphotransferase